MNSQLFGKLDKMKKSPRKPRVVNRPMAPNAEKQEKFITSELPKLVNWGTFKGLSREQSEDVAQNAILRFLRNYNSEITKPITFLYFCMNLEIYEHKRKFKDKALGGRPTSVQTTYLTPETLTKLADARGNVVLPTAEESFSTENAKRILVKLSRILSPGELQIFCLKALGKSDRTIAKELVPPISHAVVYKIYREAKYKVENQINLFEEERDNFIA